jgi:hypothetical protein
MCWKVKDSAGAKVKAKVEGPASRRHLLTGKPKGKPERSGSTRDEASGKARVDGGAFSNKSDADVIRRVGPDERQRPLP